MAVPVEITHDYKVNIIDIGGHHNLWTKRTQAVGVLVPRNLLAIGRPKSARCRGEIEMAIPVEITHGNIASTTGIGRHHNLSPKSTQAVSVLVPRDLVVVDRGRGEIEMAVPVEITHSNTVSILGSGGHHNLLTKQCPTWCWINTANWCRICCSCSTIVANVADRNSRHTANNNPKNKHLFQHSKVLLMAN
jgi:hypothetical protein